MSYKVRKVQSLPGTPEANTVYYVKGSSESAMQVFVTNNTGTIVATPIGVRASSTSSAPTHIPVFTADPASTTRELVTRTPAQLLTDIGAQPVGNYVTTDTAQTITGQKTIRNILLIDTVNNGGIAYIDSGGTYIPRPTGASFKTTTENFTGALNIALPGAIPSDMISFWVDIYDYDGGSEGESVSMYVYGYPFQTTSPFWVNVGALVLSDRTDRDYTVRFGYDGTNHTVTIGETTNTWRYPQVIVRDVQAGLNASASTFDDGWNISFVTTLPTTGQTSSQNYPVTKRLAVARNINGVAFDGNANINVPSLLGTNGTTTLATTGVTSAVNNLTITNSATGQPVNISTAGTDTNIGLTITTKGNGNIILDTGTGTGDIELKPGASNLRLFDDDSTHYYQFVTGNRTANYNINLPAGDVTLVAGTMVATSRTLTFTTNNGLTGGAAALDLSTDRSWTFGLTGQALALHNLGSNGLIARTGSGTVAARTITGTANQITVTNGDGVGGNPTLSTPQDIHTGASPTFLRNRLNGTPTAWNITTPGTGIGDLHIGSASSTTNAGFAITFGARDSSSGGTGQAGIYINSDASYGTRMYLATTNVYSTGAQNAISISEAGLVTILRSGLTLSAATTTLSFSSTTGAKTISTGGTTDLALSPGGNVRIGTAALTNGGKLQVGGDVRATGDVIAFASSDKRLKDNLKQITSPLEKINLLNGYSFTWNDKQDTYKGSDYGVIAQEVEELFPEMVTTRDNGYKAVKYEKLIPVLIEAIKELNNKIKILEGDK